MQPVQIPNFIAIGSGRTLTIWNTQADGATSNQISCPAPLASAAWNHNGQVVAVCYKGGTSEDTENCVSLFSSQSGETLNEFGNDRLQGCQVVQFGGKSRLLCCTCNTNRRSVGNFVSIWDLKRMTEARKFEESRDSLVSASLDSSDTFVFTLTERTFSAYLLKEAQKIAEVECTDDVHVKYTCFDSISTQEQTLLALGDSMGRVNIYDLENALKSDRKTRIRPVATINVDGTNRSKEQEPQSKVTSLQVLFFDDVLAVLSPNRLLVYNWLNQVVVADVKMKNVADRSEAKCFCWNGSVVAIGLDCGKVVLLDWRTSRILAEYEAPCDNDGKRFVSVDCLAFSPQNFEGTTVNSVIRSQLQGTKDNPAADADTSSKNSMVGSTRSLASSVAVQEMVRSEINKLGLGGSSSDKNHSNETISKAQHNDFHPDSFSQQMSKTIDLTASHLTGNAEAVSDNTEEYNQTSISLPSSSSYNMRRSVVEEEKQHYTFVHAEERILTTLRDEIKEAINNLHVDMIRQFQIQADEMNSSLSRQLDVMDRMADENQRLRQENRLLREHLRQHEYDPK